jgi:hypothetical protein
MDIKETLLAEAERLQAELKKVYRLLKEFGGSPTKRTTGRRRRVSAATRLKMKRAAKARWASRKRKPARKATKASSGSEQT